MQLPIDVILDLERYPLHMPDSPGYSAMVRDKRDAWLKNGACALPGLMRPDSAVAAARELLEPMRHASFRHDKTHNIYFTDDAAKLPPDLAARSLRTRHRTLTCDQLEGTIIRSVYEWDPLRAFIQAILGLSALYPMADPMARLNVMAYGDSDGLDWHFDRARFAVTILLQAAASGGQFEYRRGLRSTTDPNYDGVRRLLNGDDDQVRRTRSVPGTMALFAGFNSAHRVVPVQGDTARMTAVLSYMEEPDYQYNTEDRMRFYGRPEPDAPITPGTV